MLQHDYILVIDCPDQVGIVATVSQFIAGHGGWILEASHHSDSEAQWFFMRYQIVGDSLPFNLAEFRRQFAPIAERFRMNWRISDTRVKKRVVLLVSKQDHCLSDLLTRWRGNELNFEIPCVISNHNDLRAFVEFHRIPFFHVPIPAADGADAFIEIERLYTRHRGDCMVLARYMQILPTWLVEKYSGQILNIHHSFLPSFSGAKPYHQAFLRGVKLIGATSHYVTPELDAGPIIDQEVMRVNHDDTVADMMRLGRDVEKLVLARTVRYHLQDRVIIHKNKTVVFS